ncbi:MAG: hypothetical protein ISR90_07075 [Candidatus Marinimicrobia bacterium]|nr:hypothetical protein [Candidatus Neomarinimicrobiota bacterium]
MNEKKYIIAINTCKGYKIYWNGYSGFCKPENAQRNNGFPLTKEDKRYKQGFKRANEILDGNTLGETVEVIEWENPHV